MQLTFYVPQVNYVEFPNQILFARIDWLAVNLTLQPNSHAIPKRSVRSGNVAICVRGVRDEDN